MHWIISIPKKSNVYLPIGNIIVPSPQTVQEAFTLVDA